MSANLDTLGFQLAAFAFDLNPTFAAKRAEVVVEALPTGVVPLELVAGSADETRVAQCFNLMRPAEVDVDRRKPVALADVLQQRPEGSRDRSRIGSGSGEESGAGGRSERNGDQQLRVVLNSGALGGV